MVLSATACSTATRTPGTRSSWTTAGWPSLTSASSRRCPTTRSRSADRLDQGDVRARRTGAVRRDLQSSARCHPIRRWPSPSSRATTRSSAGFHRPCRHRRWLGHRRDDAVIQPAAQLGALQVPDPACGAFRDDARGDAADRPSGSARATGNWLHLAREWVLGDQPAPSSGASRPSSSQPAVSDSGALARPGADQCTTWAALFCTAAPE